MAEKAEDTKCASHQQAEEILYEDKENVEEVWRLASRKMAYKMAEMEDNTAEVIRVTLRNMADMKDRVA